MLSGAGVAREVLAVHFRYACSTPPLRVLQPRPEDCSESSPMPREAYLLVTESRFAGVNEILGPAPDDQLAVFWPQYPGQPFFWKSVVRLAMVSPARNGFHHGVSPAV